MFIHIRNHVRLLAHMLGYSFASGIHWYRRPRVSSFLPARHIANRWKRKGKKEGGSKKLFSQIPNGSDSVVSVTLTDSSARGISPTCYHNVYENTGIIFEKKIAEENLRT